MKNNKNNKPQRGRSIWYPELPHYNIQSMQFPTRKLGNMHRNKKVWHIHRKKNLIKIPPRKTQTLELLDKDFKSLVLSML